MVIKTPQRGSPGLLAVHPNPQSSAGGSSASPWVISSAPYQGLWEVALGPTRACHTTQNSISLAVHSVPCLPTVCSSSLGKQHMNGSFKTRLYLTRGGLLRYTHVGRCWETGLHTIRCERCPLCSSLSLHDIPGIHRATQDSSQPPAHPELKHLPSLSKLSRLLHSPSPTPEASFLRGLPPPACYGGSAPSLSKPRSAHSTVRVLSISASST